MPVLTWMSSNMAAGNQQKHLLPSFATKAGIYSSRNVVVEISVAERKELVSSRGAALERMAKSFYTTGRYQMLVGLWRGLIILSPRQDCTSIKYGGLHFRLCVLFAGLRTGEQSRRRREWIIIGLFTNLMSCI